jgi:hypothetical protein
MKGERRVTGNVKEGRVGVKGGGGENIKERR